MFYLSNSPTSLIQAAYTLMKNLKALVRMPCLQLKVFFLKNVQNVSAQKYYIFNFKRKAYAHRNAQC